MALKICPPGVWCMSDMLGYVLIILLVICIVIIFSGDKFVFAIRPSKGGHKEMDEHRRQPPTIINIEQPPRYTDSRFLQAPQPLRDWMAQPEFPPRGGIASIPINIPTQGLPESFQSVGMININGDALPLYGRRTNASSNRWNYYTRTNTFNPVPVPLRVSKRDCMDQVGCDELMSGDNVHLEGLGQHGKVNMYRFDGPKYIPGLI